MAAPGISRWLLALALALVPVAGSAQCAPGEVLVDEDANFYYCKNTSVYASCIRAAGIELRDARPACARRASECMAQQQVVLTQAGLACVLGCLGSTLALPRCISACGVAGVAATNVVQQCGVEMSNNCLGEALVTHKRRVDACKK
jgi:hypothetical protein